MLLGRHSSYFTVSEALNRKYDSCAINLRMFNTKPALKLLKSSIFVFFPFVGLIAIRTHIDVTLLTAHGVFVESFADIAYNHLL